MAFFVLAAAFGAFLTAVAAAMGGTILLCFAVGVFFAPLAVCLAILGERPPTLLPLQCQHAVPAIAF